MLDKKAGSLSIDSYKGPFSAKAFAMLASVTKFRDTCGQPVQFARVADNDAAFVAFEKKQRAEGIEKVSLWMQKIRKQKKEIYLQLDIACESLVPPVQRSLIVSSNLTMEELSKNVLCPVFNYDGEMHCYGFRRRICYTDKDFDIAAALKAQMEKEVWIGPVKSTALDKAHMPFYIGGALADDRKVKLGDLINEDGTIHLQYVYDFGDWISHTLTAKQVGIVDVKKHDIAAVKLISGSGVGPAVDVGGVLPYAQKLQSLTGKAPINEEMDNDYGRAFPDPSRPEWWELVNELRCKRHLRGLALSLTFDLDQCTQELVQKLQEKKRKRGRELENATQTAMREYGGRVATSRNVRNTHRDPKKYCAVCSSTVALRLCSACAQVAYCSREHQKQHWKCHKSLCKEHRKGAK